MGKRLREPAPAMTTLAAVTLHCCRCDGITEHRLLEYADRFNVLGRPAISTGRTYWLACTDCAAVTEITEGQKEHLLRFLARTRTARVFQGRPPRSPARPWPRLLFCLGQQHLPAGASAASVEDPEHCKSGEGHGQ
jgi:hypothetical protein